MTTQELHDLLTAVSTGKKTVAHAHERIRRAINKEMYFWITPIAIIFLLAVMVVSCHQSV